VRECRHRAAAPALAVLLLLGIASATAQPAPPAEQILTPTPPGFHLGEQDVGSEQRRFEFFRTGETAVTWRERISVLVFLGVKDRAPKAMAEALQAEWRGTCPAFSSHPAEQKAEKGYQTSIIVMTCDNPAPPAGREKREFAMTKIIQGRDSLYVVQRSWRDATAAPPPLTDRATGDAWAAFFRAVEVCDTRLQGQPCPALQGR